MKTEKELELAATLINAVSTEASRGLPTSITEVSLMCPGVLTALEAVSQSEDNRIAQAGFRIGAYVGFLLSIQIAFGQRK